MTAQNKRIVIKYGGNALADGTDGLTHFAADIASIISRGWQPVIVHGGGPQINAALDAQGIHSEFVQGLRVTSPAAMAVIARVLKGEVNVSIVAALRAAGVNAKGLSGNENQLLQAAALPAVSVDYGRVGNVVQVNTAPITEMLGAGITPVIAPIGVDEIGDALNVNADTGAGAVAGALGAACFFLLTNVPGVLDANKKRIPELSAERARAMVADGTISGGMIPKVETCLLAVAAGAGSAVILDGRVPHLLLQDLSGEHSAGTRVR